MSKENGAHVYRGTRKSRYEYMNTRMSENECNVNVWSGGDSRWRMKIFKVRNGAKSAPALENYSKYKRSGAKIDTIWRQYEMYGSVRKCSGVEILY